MQIRMDKENRELKAHGSYEFPVNISYEQLSLYERGSFSWHWHPEIELTFVLSGQIGYQVNGKSYVLKEGDGIFCNTNALHSGHMIDGMDCVYISTTFAPRFLYGFSNSVIQTRYVEPVLTDMQLASIVFSPEIDWQNQVLACMHRIYDLSLSQPSAFEMEIQELLLSIWIEIYRHASFSGESQNTAAARDPYDGGHGCDSVARRAVPKPGVPRAVPKRVGGLPDCAAQQPPGGNPFVLGEGGL